VAARSPARAEVVGSLLRPPELLAAVDERSDPVHLGDVADAAVERVVRRQADIGLDVVSDGEFRRWMFLNSFYDAVDGVATDQSAVEFRNERGETVVLMVPSIEERLRRVDSPAAREAAFLAGIADRPFKVTFPAASIFAHPFGGAADAYGTQDEFVEGRRAREAHVVVGPRVRAACRPAGLR